MQAPRRRLCYKFGTVASNVFSAISGVFRFIYENVNRYDAASTERHMTVRFFRPFQNCESSVRNLLRVHSLMASGIDVTRGFSENLSEPCILTTLSFVLSKVISWTVDKYARGTLIGIAVDACQQIQ
jgi:hypothetical protein